MRRAQTGADVEAVNCSTASEPRRAALGLRNPASARFRAGGEPRHCGRIPNVRVIHTPPRAAPRRSREQDAMSRERRTCPASIPQAGWFASSVTSSNPARACCVHLAPRERRCELARVPRARMRRGKTRAHEQSATLAHKFSTVRQRPRKCLCGARPAAPPPHPRELGLGARELEFDLGHAGERALSRTLHTARIDCAAPRAHLQGTHGRR